MTERNCFLLKNVQFGWAFRWCHSQSLQKGVCNLERRIDGVQPNGGRRVRRKSKHPAFDLIQSTQCLMTTHYTPISFRNIFDNFLTGQTDRGYMPCLGEALLHRCINNKTPSCRKTTSLINTFVFWNKLDKIANWHVPSVPNKYSSSNYESPIYQNCLDKFFLGYSYASVVLKVV